MINQLIKSKGHSVFSLLVILYAMGMVYTASAQSYGSMPWHKTITVYGEAAMTVKPDVVYFPMDITSTAPLIDDAYNENQVKIENTMKKLKSLGVSAKQVKVMDSQFYTIRSYNIGETSIFGVSNILVATITNIDKLKPEDLRKKIFRISQGVSRTTTTPYSGRPSAGAERLVNELSSTIGHYGHQPIAVYGLSKYKKLQKKALLEAIENAKQEAERLTEILGVEIDEMMFFHQVYPYQGSRGAPGGADKILPDGPKSGDPKSIKIYASVNVVYSFK